MNNNVNILLLSQDDIFRAGGMDFGNAIKVTEKAIREYINGNVIFPSKVSQVFDQETQDRINCLPATLINENVCGMKWVSVFPQNPKKYDLNNLNALLVLSSTVNGAPLAFMEGSLCSNVRTACVNAVAAKYLAKSNPTSIGFVGAGEQAKSAFLAIKTVYPQISKCYISSRTTKTEDKFYQTFASIYKDVEFIKCNADYEKATRNADILVSAISGQTPLIKGEWISEGTLYLHTGGWEDDFSVAQKADKIYCDNWDSVKHRGSQTISKMFVAGLLKDSDITGEIDRLLSGEIPSRENDKEFIYFNAVGLSYVDIAIANDVYLKCKEAGLGTEFNLKSCDMFKYLGQTGRF
ncbi:MAG: ornithine cyclodeaminase family protein [Clostridia bacterium]|nr:ornithine cyclodeaminase family protein [Clostridia bacterium]